MLAAVDALNAIREQVLELTSEFRTTAAGVADDLADPAALETLRRTGQRLGETARQAGIEPLLQPARVLERGPAIALALCAAQPSEARAILAATHDVLGTTEQLLDWCLDVVDSERQVRLLACLERSFPERWRSLLDGDDESFTHQLEAYAPPAAAPAALAVARELLQAFDEEAGERLRRAEELLVQLERRPGDYDLMNELFRHFHTLKGAAAEIGIDAARSQLHEAESILAAARDGKAQVAPAALAEFFFRLIDSVRALIDQANGRPAAPGAVIANVAAEIARLTGLKAIETANAGGKLPPVPAKAEQQLLAQLREKLSSTEQSDEVLRLIEALEQQAGQHSQAERGLQGQLDELRTVPLQSMLRRLLRPVRDAARQEGKLVELEVRGGEIRLDREVVERLHGPLLHIARNAVSHGIEPPSAREAVGKPPTGNLRVHAHQHNGHLVITVTDDGAGLDYETIYAKASAHGWVDSGRLPPRHELARFILRPGFSTKDEVTDLAGRGVGMDVVAREIDALNGHIDIESLDGRGTSIRLTVPLPSA